MNIDNCGPKKKLPTPAVDDSTLLLYVDSDTSFYLVFYYLYSILGHICDSVSLPGI